MAREVVKKCKSNDSRRMPEERFLKLETSIGEERGEDMPFNKFEKEIKDLVKQNFITSKVGAHLFNLRLSQTKNRATKRNQKKQKAADIKAERELIFLKIRRFRLLVEKIVLEYEIQEYRNAAGLTVSYHSGSLI